MATNIYDSIAEAWEADATLKALIPSERIFNGRNEDEDLPYVVIDLLDDRRQGRSSKGNYWMEEFQISVYVSDLTLARRVQKEYRRVLDAMVPTLDDGDLISWQRMSGGRSTEEGAIGRALDIYLLEKQTDR